jgi:hypothetical protein
MDTGSRLHTLSFKSVFSAVPCARLVTLALSLAKNR